MEDVALSCTDLSSGYDGRIVLHAIDLELRKGAATALLGPNGSGKSTLLKTLMRLVPRQSGKVKIFGRGLDDLTTRELASQVSYVPQEEPHAFPFSVREIVTMGRLPRSNGLFDTEEDRVAAVEAMTMAGGLAIADRPITDLSGGERQRALFARALAQGGALMLLDEPTAHMDLRYQTEVVRRVRLLTEAGVTVLAAVHDLNLAEALATSAILLSEGRVVARGETVDVLRSGELDAAYETRFRRLEDEEGRLVVLPPWN